MTTLETGSLFRVRTYKSPAENPSHVFSNTYEVLMVGGFVVDNLNEALLGFVNAEKTIHNDAVEYRRAVLSTWEDDSETYNPGSFYVWEAPAGTRGTRAVGTDKLDSKIVLTVRRQATTGRSGKLAYRGVIAEGDMETGNDLDAVLTSGALTELNDVLNDMRADMQAVLTLAANDAGNTARMVLAGVAKGTTEVVIRPVTNFVARGISVMQTDYRWYNRSE